MTLREKKPGDRRVQKTQGLLREALGSLIHEKSYDAIAVQEILDRANVGRSTFYIHFRDKDELLVSGMLERLRSARPAELPSSARPYERIIWFSLPIFEHLDQQRRIGKMKIGIKGRAIIHEHLQKVLVELIADEVMKSYPGRRRAQDGVPPDLFVQYLASTFILVLNWWVERSAPLPPGEINDLFRMLILPTLAAALE